MSTQLTNLFVAVTTYSKPWSNYRAENEQNRSVLQKLKNGSEVYAVAGSTAIRCGVRDTMAALGMPVNRSRPPQLFKDDDTQLTVAWKAISDPQKFVDDALMGYMTTINKEKKADKEIKESLSDDFATKRDSVLRINHGVSLRPYKFDAMLMQSPMLSKDSPKALVNNKDSALLNVETLISGFQYPWCINLNDLRKLKHGEEWGRLIIGQVMSQIVKVAGNNARTWYDWSPASVVGRLTNRLAAGFNTYGYTDVDQFPSLITALVQDELPADEFYLGGELVKSLSEETQTLLKKKNAHISNSCEAIYNLLAQRAYPSPKK